MSPDFVSWKLVHAEATKAITETARAVGGKGKDVQMLLDHFYLYFLLVL